MRIRTSFIYGVFAVAIISITLQACKKDEPAVGIDLELLNMAEETSNFVWYKFDNSWLPKSSGSAHNYNNLRTRYNFIAADQLDTDGKVMANASFPEGSVIVKELSDGNAVELYAILYKQSASEYADDNGWVWGYVNSDATVETSAEGRGVGCISCHSQQGNIDYMLMNTFFP
jgi:hypothetical protein